MHNCPNGAIPYTIQPGDTLVRIARRFDTTADMLLQINPGLHPDYLYIGQVIYICKMQIPTPYSFNPSPEGIKELMRSLWEQHVAWTRMVIISAVNNLPDKTMAVNRLLSNAVDFKNALTPYYGVEIASKFGKLIEEHLRIAIELVAAAKAHKGWAVDKAEKRWYKNADEIAAFLASINPYLNEQKLIEMLHLHLAMTKSEAVALLNRDYGSSIKTYDEIEKEALMMADAMADGISKQFIERGIR